MIFPLPPPLSPHFFFRCEPPGSWGSRIAMHPVVTQALVLGRDFLGSGWISAVSVNLPGWIELRVVD